MKWPTWLIMMRHDVSVYNVLRDKKSRDPLYQEFLRSFKKDWLSLETAILAKRVQEKFRLQMGDHNTPLTDSKSAKAEEVGRELRSIGELPDVIFISPYDRTWATFEGLKRGWPELEKVKWLEEERIREMGHGLALLCNDKKVFEALNPKQKLLREIEGPYWYKYPQGENIPRVRERNHSWLGTLIDNFAEKKVLAISHHVNILVTRANLERWSASDFIGINNNEKPINCGLTRYDGHPQLGSRGRFKLTYYNEAYYAK